MMDPFDPPDTGDISNNDHPGPPTLKERAIAQARHRFRQVRLTPAATKLLGPQYQPSSDCLAIDLTWACNLSCNNCSRSLGPAPTGDRMTVGQIHAFIQESEATNRIWKRIRLIGGEPTLHPDFLEIVDLLTDYIKRNAPASTLQLATNGHGKKVCAVLEKVKDRVEIVNSYKDGDDVRTGFDPFNEAPIDDKKFEGIDFSNACPITDVCGMGLNRHGYYGCAVAGAIDRVVGLNLARASLPNTSDGMREQLRLLCRWCGHFKTGMKAPRSTRAPIFTQRNSQSWERAFKHWREAPPKFPLYREILPPKTP